MVATKLNVSDKENESLNDSDDDSYRQVPYNIEAEQAILGALLTNNDSLNRVSDYLHGEHFYGGVHQRIFEAIVKFTDKGLLASPITLKNYFDKDESLTEVGGADYLISLASNAAAIINLEDFGKLVYDLAIKRNLIAIGEDVVNEAYKDDIDSSAALQIESAEQRLFDLASEGVSEKGFVQLAQPLSDAVRTAEIAHKNKAKISGIDTGFLDLNDLLGGFHNSDLLILAGRPSMGKTAFSVNLAINACKAMQAKAEDKDKPLSVGFFSLEMSSEQLAARMLAMEAGIDSTALRKGSLHDDDFTKVVQGNASLYNLPLFMDDTPALTISALRTRARRLKRKNNLGLLVIDYLQLVRGSSKSSSENRVQEVSEVTQGMKAIAKELNIPVIALSQLSRAVEQREDKRPQLSDLRESGSIEQDSDIVMFIYREEYYVMRKEPTNEDESDPKRQEWREELANCQNITDIIVAKHRNGPVGNVKLRFDNATTKFVDFTPNY